MSVSSSSTVRVIIADDHPVVRAGLSAILSGHPQIRVVGEVGDGASLLQALAKTPADVAILDFGMPGREGLALLRHVRNKAPGLRIIVCSMYDPSIYAKRALQLGAYAFLEKNVAPTQLVATVLAAAASPVTAPPPPAKASTEPPHTQLSDRQFEVFALLVQGLSVTEISNKLHLSIKTVSTHKVAVQRRLGAHSVVDLVKYATAHGLIDPQAAIRREAA
ncbi:MAG: response regulator [Casimicrobiaceae bacterium]